MTAITDKKITLNYDNNHSQQLDLFRDRLPSKPYHADDLAYGLRIDKAIRAIGAKHIQPNGPTHKHWLVFDIDHADAARDWYDVNAPEPNIVVTNRSNGHAHLLYGLEVPVRTAHDANPKPLRYAAAVEHALGRKLKADINYSGLICKNPLHPHWRVETYQSELYDLGWLSDYVDLSPYADRRKNMPAYGLGRNCNLFDQTRKWAYRAIRQEWPSIDAWLEQCFKQALSYNQSQFDQPLPINEVKHVARSIGKWTYQNMSAAGFSAYQAKVGAKGGQKSKRLKLPDSNESIKPWDDLGVSRATYYRHKKQVR